MLFDEKFRKLRASFARNAPTDPAQEPISNVGLGPKLPALSIADLLAPMDAAASAAPRAPFKNIRLEDLFVTHASRATRQRPRF